MVHIVPVGKLGELIRRYFIILYCSGIGPLDNALYLAYLTRKDVFGNKCILRQFLAYDLDSSDTDTVVLRNYNGYIFCLYRHFNISAGIISALNSLGNT